jgi:methanogenesis imperfect marker protein 11
MNLSVDLKLRFYNFFGNMAYFRNWQIRKEWRVIMMADPEGETVERVSFSPSWFGSMTTQDIAKGFSKIAKDHVETLDCADGGGTYGNMIVQHFKTGEIDVRLIPSYMPWAVTRVVVEGDSIFFAQKGIGGAPDLLRLWAVVAKRYTEKPMDGGGVIFESEYPLYRKIVIGLDDTDTAAKGATVNTARTIAVKLGRAIRGVEFLRFVVSLNWPHNPYKTTNNASSGMVFAVRPGKEEELINWFVKLAKKNSFSKETGLAVMNRVRMPEELVAYSRKVKMEEVDVSETYEVAEKVGARLIPITGERGLIGALSVVGLIDSPSEALIPREDAKKPSEEALKRLQEVAARKTT